MVVMEQQSKAEAKVVKYKDKMVVMEQQSKAEAKVVRIHMRCFEVEPH